MSAPYNRFAGKSLERIALVVYWLNILVLGLSLFFSWRYALRAGLVKDEVPPELRSAVERRIVIAQSP